MMTLDGIFGVLPRDPALIWGCFTRLVGLVFLVSYASLWGQVVPTAGPDGVNPIRHMHVRIRKDFPGLRRFVYFPTLLWISDSARALRLLVFAGLVGSVWVIFGGPHSFWALLLCYVVYVSLDRAMGLVFPWDCLLFETAFLALLLPSLLPLPELAAVAAPPAALSWAYRLLLLRVMLGFGKFKFAGSSKEDWGYLHGFFINQPLVSKFGWYAQKLPLPLLKLSLFIMFISEVPMPLLFMAPNELGLLAGLAMVGLMVVINLSGNFGYFSLLMICLGVTLLDMTTPRTLDLFDLWSGSNAECLTNAVVLVHSVAGIVIFPLNSFTGQAWTHWPIFLRFRPRWLVWPVTVQRLLHPLRWLHPYGVFPPKTLPPVKAVPIIEVSWDGQAWHDCAHTFSPTRPDSPPRFIAPHHPRGDQAVIYETFGLNDTSLYHNLVGTGQPYGFAHLSGAHALLQRILEGKDYGGVFLAKGSLPKHRGTPIAARIRTHMLLPTSHEQRMATGNWWSRVYVGPHIPETRLKKDFWDSRLPEPELWHFEDVIWKRRSTLGGLMKRALAGEDHTEIVVSDGELDRADVDSFWGEFIERTGQGDEEAWQRLPQIVEDVRKHFGSRRLHRMERVHGRLSSMLGAQLEPLLFDAGLAPVFGGRRPVVDVLSHFHLGMLVHHVMAQGRAVYEAVAAEPRSVVTHVPTLDMFRGNFHMAIFRHEPMIFEAQKLRLVQCFFEPEGQQMPTARPAVAERLDAIARQVWGIVDLVPFLRERFVGVDYERGQPEAHPSFVLQPDTTIAVKAMDSPSDDSERRVQ